ncbi:hypothetical protein SAMN04488569_10263 [Marinilactibacillus piezotolerans]|uniref:Uncharacterized protein n=1 Tax=Marinilactibacillus piezotolerans TaxID=258723 RepID=A0A1I3YWG1_9LACT|nr:hypothetical protein [Marinilactibacillus piezotolerans]SFK36165.1 hypothetical protein SAMN04488569_10263 [Marinilactibacillus piezotolerans]
MNFKSVDSLQPIVNVINETNQAVQDKSRTMIDSPLSDMVSGALGAGIGGAVSFAGLYGLGTVGLSAVGITSGLATAGSIVGGGMVSGVFVLAAPVAIIAGGGIALNAKRKKNKLKREKERLYQEALKKHNAVIEALKEEVNATNDRMEYLNGLNILLQQAIKELRSDLEGV